MLPSFVERKANQACRLFRRMVQLGDVFPSRKIEIHMFSCVLLKNID